MRPSVQNGPDLLATIVAAARRVTEMRALASPLATVEEAAAARTPDGAGFLAALRDGPAPRVIAECKRRSPSRGILRQDYDAAAHARAYAAAGAAAISVLTEPTFFDGALEHLAAVRDAVSIPILRKDFIVTRYQVYEAVHGWRRRGAADCWRADDGGAQRAARRRAGRWAWRRSSKSTTSRSWRCAVDAGARIVGVNSRNLRTLAVEPALHERLAAQLPKGTVAVAESGLRQTADLQRLERAGYHAFLVGERLIVQPDPGAARSAR